MISVTSNIDEVMRGVDRYLGQAPFAIALALTRTAQDVARAMPAEVEQAFEGGAVPFTKQAFTVRAATKSNLTAYVVIKPHQAKYLGYQIQGGTRRPRNVALRLPADVKLTAEGNLPAGTIARLVQRAKAGKRATKAQAARFGVSRDLDLFYGDPADSRPAGVYKRVTGPSGVHKLVPVVVFPRISARYKSRFDFHGVASRKVAQVFGANLTQALAKAQATAR